MRTLRRPRTGDVITVVALTLLASFGLWTAGRLTKTFDFYTTPTLSNMPTFQLGDHFFISRFVRPERGQFIAYYPNVAGAENTAWMHRLCGLAGDTIEVSGGQLFVNGRRADAGLTLAHQYRLRAPDYRRLPQAARADSASVEFRGDSVHFVNLADADATRLGARARRQLLRRQEPDPSIAQRHGQPWNADYFGPIVVPPNCYFVLGDNRRNAMDSRYTGFIEQRNFVGTVLGR